MKSAYLNQSVRLSDRGLRLYSAGHSSSDWPNRTGIVARLTKDRSRAYVRWGDNKSLSDAIPVSCLELVEMAPMLNDEMASIVIVLSQVLQ